MNKYRVGTNKNVQRQFTKSICYHARKLYVKHCMQKKLYVKHCKKY